MRVKVGRWECSFVACLGRSTIDHAPLSRRSGVGLGLRLRVGVGAGAVRVQVQADQAAAKQWENIQRPSHETPRSTSGTENGEARRKRWRNAKRGDGNTK